MSVLLAFLYADESIADEVMDSVEKLSHEGHIELEDACALIKDRNGKIHLHQETQLSFFGAVSGLVLGTFIGWLVLFPYLGIPAAILGALSGKISDHGIRDSDMKDLSKEMQSESSALFLMVRGSSLEAVLQELAPYGGNIFYTSLSKSQEQDLEEKFEQLRPGKRPEIDRSPEMHD